MRNALAGFDAWNFVEKPGDDGRRDELLIYLERGLHDFYYFTIRDGTIRRMGSWSAFE